MPTSRTNPLETALRIVQHYEVFLFLAALITITGLMALSFSLLRHRWDDRLLQWFALFAILYGLRLGVNYQPMWAFGVAHPVLEKVTLGLGYLAPTPAFFFLRRWP